jgi:hypothetical protein
MHFQRKDCDILKKKNVNSCSLISSPLEDAPITVLSIMKQTGEKQTRFFASIPHIGSTTRSIRRIYLPAHYGHQCKGALVTLKKECNSIMKKMNMNQIQNSTICNSYIHDDADRPIKKIGHYIRNRLGLKFLFDYLNDDLIQEELGRQITISNNNPQPPYLIIYTDEPGIPWEIAYDADKQTYFGNQFLIGIKLIENVQDTLQGLEQLRVNNRNQNVSSWIVNKDSSANIDVKKSSFLLFGYEWKGDPVMHIPRVQDELKTVKKLILRKIPRYSESINADYHAMGADDHFFDLLLSKDKDNVRYCDRIKLLHYAGHMVDGCILLGGPDVDPIDGNTMVNLGITFKSEPIVFLNACSSGMIQDVYKKTSALASTFMALGASACVVTNQPVSDRVATIFAKTFYEHLIKGDSIGNAMYEAKSDCYKANPNDPTYLFYRLYGDARQKFM